MSRNNELMNKSMREQILDYIRDHQLGPEDILPGEIVLMEMLNASRYSIRKALDILEQENIIYKIKGKGTFVKSVPFQIESGLEKLESITTIIKKSGMNPGTKWLGIEFTDPTEDMIEALNLDEKEKVITFKRVRLADGVIAAYCIDTIPLKYLNEIPLEINDESMFSFLNSNYDIRIETSTTYVEPSYPTWEMKEKLNIEESKLFNCLTQIHYDNYREPIIFSKDYFDPLVIKFRINRLR
jgi:GntR family transcriptional regulator